MFEFLYKYSIPLGLLVVGLFSIFYKYLTSPRLIKYLQRRYISIVEVIT